MFTFSAGQTNIVLSTFDNAANINPYWMNTTYQRPTNTESDLGYSTMTPHEDSELASTTCVESLIIGRDRYRPPPSRSPKDSAGTTILPPPPGNSRARSKAAAAATTDGCEAVEGITEIRDHAGGAAVPSPWRGSRVEEMTTLLPHQIIASVQVHSVDVH